MASLETGAQPESGLRKRAHLSTSKLSGPLIESRTDSSDTLPAFTQPEANDNDKSKIGSSSLSHKIMGRTPDGTVFTVPHTPDMLTSIFDPRQPKTPLDLFTIASLAFQILSYFFLSRKQAQVFFFFYFFFWRGSYNAGLGWVLKQQSERGWIVQLVNERGWVDQKRKPKVRQWIKQQLVTKMDKDYDFEALPIDYNIWLIFRSFVDVILLNDFVAYSLFAFSCTRLPEDHSIAMHILRWVVGWALIFFNLWVKMDAHRVVKDYAWYWGDCFFLCLQSLVFDGVYEIAPDPMYSIGYAGYYGLSLVSGSYAVLFVSLAAHFFQFLFMCYFEGPHIERTYGEKKPLAARVPLRRAPFNAASRRAAAGSISDPLPEDQEPGSPKNPAESASNSASATSSQTEGSSALTEDDTDEEERLQRILKRATLRTAASSNDAIQSHLHGLNEEEKTTSLHDLHHRIFRKDTVVFKNIDLMRGNDFLLVIAATYGLIPLLLPSAGQTTRLTLLFINALAWRIFHSVILGSALKAQSETKWIVRHFLKHYNYEHPEDAVFEAFSNWKVIYNTSLLMTYLSFSALCWNCFVPFNSTNWTVGTDLLRVTLGLMLVALHVWTANSSYSVLGPFGWLYGDFFIDEYPHQLYYTGIYRFLNNPERSMGGAAFFGLCMISGSKLSMTMAFISYVAHWGFLSFVEGPHMRKLYGEAAVRKDSGVTKQLKSVTKSGVFKAAQEHPSVKNMQGTFEKVHRDATVAFEDFFIKNKPKFEGVLEDTKILLQQSRDRLLIVRVGEDSNLDRSKFKVDVLPSKVTGETKFHLGEPIRIRWTAAPNHSRRDWIGIYYVSRFGGPEGAEQSSLVTKISSQGKWLGVAENEWEGDVHTGPTLSGLGTDGKARSSSEEVKGITVFSGAKLPWSTGTYEVRYHHDAKHNVLARSKPIELYVSSANPSNYESTYLAIRTIVCYSLSSQPSTPKRLSISGENPIAPLTSSSISTDDFTIWDTTQAKKIASAIKQGFNVDFSPEVVIAEANVSRLAKDVVEGSKLLRS